MKTISLFLADDNDTLKIGQCIAKALEEFENIRLLLLFGSLGAGKTTFARGFVSALKNCERAEVSSPTFTLVNQYPTNPQVYHADMYRLKEMQGDGEFIDLPEEIEEIVEEKSAYALIEWAEYLDINAMPLERLDICFEIGHDNRSLLVKCGAKNADILLQKINQYFQD